ncbi:hypothetical protein C8R45DRAFT_1110204 [Mycena sanguinolenta]|nr:hypothetical protein C8R45DRAFT_1110204 [Mycena sanguinolenta]
MDTKNIFDNSDDAMVSLKLKRMVADYILIPQELEFDLLPSPYLSIANMLEFSLPIQSKTNPALHEALIQTSVIDLPAVNAKEEAYTTREAYDDCDSPLVSDHLRSGGSSVASNFTVSDDGGIARSGNAEASDAEDDEGMLHPLLFGEASTRKSLRGIIWAPFGKSTSFVRVFSAEFLSNF